MKKLPQRREEEVRLLTTGTNHDKRAHGPGLRESAIARNDFVFVVNLRGPKRLRGRRVRRG
jgi:hypothetical protein